MSPLIALAGGSLLAAGSMALVVLRRRLVVVTVIGSSMAPTYAPGERVLVRRVPARALRRGQVVVFGEPDSGGGWARPLAGPGAAGIRSAALVDGPAAGPTGWMIKRVAAVPGDPVPGDVADVAGVADVLGESSGDVVPPNRFVVVGDNPKGSFDSHVFGYVPGDRVLGVVARRLGRGRPVTGDVEGETGWTTS